MAGELIVADYQYQYGGLLMGHGTNYIVTELEGIYSMPDITSFDQKKQADHGMFPGFDTYNGKSMIINIQINAADDEAVEALIQNLSAVFHLSQTEYPLVMRRPNWGGNRYINCRTRRRSIKNDWHYSIGMAPAVVELFASDPRIYKMNPSSQVIDMLTIVTSASTNLNNQGMTDSPTTILITGGIKDPIIANATDNNRQIKLTCDIPSDVQLRINTGTKEIVTSSDNGATWVPHYEFMRPDSQWWELRPGLNSILVSCQPTVGAKHLMFTWNDAWI